MRSPGNKPEKSATPAEAGDSSAEETPRGKQGGKKAAKGGAKKGGSGLSKGAQDQKFLTRGQKKRQRLRQMNLTELATEFRTDKHGSHFYTPHYQRYFRHLRREAITVLEIGVGGYKRQTGGGSLRMWKWFFPKAQIIGLDIEDKSFVDEPRVRTVIGSQTDESVLRQIIEEEGAPMVVIDDGSHVPADIIATFGMLFPLLPDGAVYAIEDTQTSYWPEWGGQIDRDAEGTTMWLVRQLIDGLNHEEFLDEDHTPSYSDRHVVAVHCFHNLVIIEKGVNDEGSNKREVLLDRFGHPDK